MSMNNHFLYMRKTFLFLSLLFSVCLVAGAADSVRVACVGNSITYGIGVKDRTHDSYPARLQNMLGGKYLVGSFGKPGATLLNKGHRPYIEQQEYKDALDFMADIVVIHLGVNDTDPRDWPDFRDDFVRDYVSLVNSFKALNPDVKVILAGITPIWDRHPRFLSGTKVWQDEIREKISVVADICGARLIDFYTPLYKYPFMFPDAVHPDEEGAAILAKTVYSAITGDFGGLKVSDVYSDNMVLQRDTLLEISGTSDAGDSIEVTLDGKKFKTVVDESGKWSVHVGPLQAKRNIGFSVSNGKKMIDFKNVAVGEVWLCSGQSNMEFMLKSSVGAEKAIGKSECADIRLYDMKARWRTDAVEWPLSALDSVNHLKYYKDTSWNVCGPESSKDFSAVAYYFGKMLHDSLNVPVGLICNAVGGSTTESWIDRYSLETEFHSILKDWRNNDFIQKWARERACLNIKKSVKTLQRHPYEPCYLFESGILPLEKYPVKGVIWYQGESNAHNMEAHDKLFRLLVNSWRKHWNNESMPFYFVQLSSLNRPSWPCFRDSQRKLMNDISYSGMAVSSDWGDSLDVHPRNKRPVGERLARWALSGTYGYDILPSGPLFRNAVVVDNGMVSVGFDYAKGMSASEGRLTGFEIAEYDGLYYPAEAEIKGERVLLTSSEVKNPKYVRYGWQPFTRANLVNEDGLPASTFMSEIKGVDVPCLPVSHGVSAPFSGIIDDCLIVAGGCNFPGVPAADGGKKVYYSGIYAINLNDYGDKKWRLIGKLPQNVAYGTTVVVGDKMYFIGGENENGMLGSVYRISIDKSHCKVQLEKLPSLPEGMSNLSGTAIGNRIYITGGITESSRNNMYTISVDLLDKWEKLPKYPGNKRIQSILLGNGSDELYLVGGFQSPLKKKSGVLSDDVLCYNTEKRIWKRMTKLPEEADGGKRCLVGGSGVLYKDMLILTGGVNYSVFSDAINGNVSDDYLKKPVDWYRFNDDILVFSLKDKTWTTINDINGMSKAGGVLLENDGLLYMVCGELKPGIRTDKIIVIPLDILL